MILIDAGPLVALADADDEYHADCVAAATHIREPLGTVWPALAEAMHFLADVPRAQDKVWEMFTRGSVELLAVGLEDIPRIRALMNKYANRPMDLADAALVTVAEREGIRTIFTVDKKDFAVYRLHGRGRFTIIP